MVFLSGLSLTREMLKLISGVLLKGDVGTCSRVGKRGLFREQWNRTCTSGLPYTAVSTKVVQKKRKNIRDNTER